MRILTVCVLFALCGVLEGTLQMDKNLQYNCYYQILKLYSTKSYNDYDYDPDHNHRLDDRLHLNDLGENPITVTASYKRVRREIFNEIDEDHSDNFIRTYSRSYVDDENRLGIKRGSSTLSPTSTIGSKSIGMDPLQTKEPTYFIVASKILRPGFPYRVSVSVVQSQLPIKVYANISCNSVQLSGDSADIQEGGTETLLLHVAPDSLPKQECKLRLEGFFMNVFCDLALLHESPLEVAQRSTTIFLQTDRSLYKQGDTVRFRVSGISADFRGSDSVVEIFLIDPNQHITRRWLTRLSNSGTVSLDYRLPQQLSFGEWTINATLVDQPLHERVHFVVEEFYRPRFEIDLNMPAVFFTTSTYIRGRVTANFTSGKPVRGNLTLEAVVRPIGHFDPQRLNKMFRMGFDSGYEMDSASLSDLNNRTNVLLNRTEYFVERINMQRRNKSSQEPKTCLSINLTQQFYSDFQGIVDFKWPMQELDKLRSNMKGLELLVTAKIGDRLHNEILSGYSMSRVYNPTIRISFLGGSPQIFKPSMTFSTFVMVEYVDGSPLDVSLLKEGHLEVTGSIETNLGIKLEWPKQKLNMLRHRAGIWEVKVDLRNDLKIHERPHLREMFNGITQMKLRGKFTSESDERPSFAQLLLVSHFSPRNQHIKVTTSTETPTVGEYIIFHISTNFFLESFNYLIISKGAILVSDRETFADGMQTIAIVVSAEMFPVAKIVVWSVTWQGQVVVDSLTFPVAEIYQNNFTLNVVRRHQDFINGRDEVSVAGEPGAFVGLSGYDREMYTMFLENKIAYPDISNKMAENYKTHCDTIKHLWVPHKNPFEIRADYPAPTAGIDANRTFELNDLLIISDGIVPRRNSNCSSSFQTYECLSGGCVPLAKKCNGIWDCSDGSDEIECGIESNNHRDMLEFYKYRTNRRAHHYQSVWLWEDVTIGSNGRYNFFVNRTSLPTVPLIISGFSTSFTKGIGTISETMPLESGNQLSVLVEMPRESRYGEHVSVGVILWNYMNEPLAATITLPSSQNYTFIDGPDDDSLRFPSMSKYQHLTNIRPRGSVEVLVPIVPTILGTLEVKIEVATSIGSETVVRHMNVKKNAITRHQHLTLVLDLRKQNYIVEYINLTHSSQMKMLNRARISLTTDVLGGFFPQLPFLTLFDLTMETAEDNAFAFAMHLYALVHSKRTNRKSNDEKEMYIKLNLSYQRLLSFLHPDGSFSQIRSDWSNLESSVWLTAHCLQLLQEAASYKLENYIWIDENIMEKGVKWLLQHQAPEGYFFENSDHAFSQNYNFSLTSHVLITLSNLRNKNNSLVNHAKMQALSWIEHNMPYLQSTTEPYDIAITTYALLLWNSPLAEQTMATLRKLERTRGPFTYWSKEELSMPQKIEDAYWYSSAHSIEEHDSLSIRTSSYALMAYMLGAEPNVGGILNWLNANRLHEAGWSSTRDTSVALRALMQFARSTRVRPSSATTIEIDMMKYQVGKCVALHVNDSTPYESYETSNLWNTFKVTAKGDGYALLHVHVEDDDPDIVQQNVPAFKLYNKVGFRDTNGSQLSYNTCLKLINTQQSGDSVLTVLDVSLPTGYGIQQQDLDRYVLRNSVKNLIRAKFLETRIVFYFDKLDYREVCIEFTVQRWNPVAYISPFLPMRVYDYHAPERFVEILVDVGPMQYTEICDVCGSSKCTTCLSKSNALYKSASKVIVFISAVAILFHHIYQKPSLC